MGSKMTLVNIDPHVILHQKTHVPRAVNFFESQKVSEHPVGYSFFVPLFLGFTQICKTHFEIAHKVEST